MASLWQLTQEELSFISLMEENGGELTDEIAEELAIRRDNFKDKADIYPCPRMISMLQNL